MLDDKTKREIVLVLAPETRPRFSTTWDLDYLWRCVARGNHLYLHKKGGVYRKLMEGRSSDTGQPVIIYEHLWPHGREIYVRDKAEFEEPGRFERITS